MRTRTQRPHPIADAPEAYSPAVSLSALIRRLRKLQRLLGGRDVTVVDQDGIPLFSATVEGGQVVLEFTFMEPPEDTIRRRQQRLAGRRQEETSW